jgi:predicted outer membrane repeat protein
MKFVLVVALLTSTTAFAGVVGSGTPTSCTQAALQAQIAAGGTITFNCGAGPQTIAITFPLFFGPTDPKVTIDGNDTITLDGTGTTSGMINVGASGTSLADVTFKHITLANGNISTGLNAGGTIQNFGRLTLDSITLKNSRAGDAIFQEPCTGCLTPSLTATHCLFQNNTSSAINMEGGLASFADSTFTGNTSPTAAAIDVDSNATFTVVMSIDRCTFSGNTATFTGGAIGVQNLNTGSSVTIKNSTFTGNSVTGSTALGAAIYLSASPVTIANCTIAGNTAAASGGAIFFSNRKPVTFMNNTIIANNSGGNCRFDSSTFTGGHNLQFGDSTCTGVTVANPLLGPLADNGGLTQTMALGAGSPAIDGGDGGVAPPTDQRGVLRNDGNGDGIVASDIGAFEAAAVTGGNVPPPLMRRRAVKP